MNQLRKDEGTITITHITPHTHACTIIPQQQCMFGLPSFRALFSSFLLFSSSLLSSSPILLLVSFPLLFSSLTFVTAIRNMASRNSNRSTALSAFTLFVSHPFFSTFTTIKMLSRMFNGYLGGFGMPQSTTNL